MERTSSISTEREQERESNTLRWIWLLSDWQMWRFYPDWSWWELRMTWKTHNVTTGQMVGNKSAGTALWGCFLCLYILKYNGDTVCCWPLCVLMISQNLLWHLCLYTVCTCVCMLNNQRITYCVWLLRGLVLAVCFCYTCWHYLSVYTEVPTCQSPFYKHSSQH